MFRNPKIHFSCLLISSLSLGACSFKKNSDEKAPQTLVLQQDVPDQKAPQNIFEALKAEDQSAFFNI